MPEAKTELMTLCRDAGAVSPEETVVLPTELVHGRADRVPLR